MNVIPFPRTDYLTTRELAEVRNVSLRTVSRWVDDGCPVEDWSRPGSQKRFLRFRLARVDRWLAQRNAA